jgi:hypothetical protein
MICSFDFYNGNFYLSPTIENSLVFDREHIDNYKRSPFLWAMSCCHCTMPTLKHHIAQRTAKKWLSPLFGFGLTHAPKMMQEFVGKHPFVGKCVGRQPQPITSGLLQAGCASRDKYTENQIFARVENSLGIPPAASRHPVVRKQIPLRILYICSFHGGFFSTSLDKLTAFCRVIFSTSSEN